MASKRTNHDPESMKARISAIRTVFSPALGVFTQAEFARSIGISPTTWGNYEKNGMRPQIDEALKLVERFGLTLDWIYLGDRRYLPLEIAERLDHCMIANVLEK
ncbi:MAG: putative transcriptional regulator [Candidatus Tokpelaia sp. JSC189]|nr:MAG: putative transcriptional regulator [Candidatus Tokpelaia sp. JSC189]